MAYIEKEKAQEFLRTECLAKYPASFANGLLAAADQLNKLPAADVVEVVRSFPSGTPEFVQETNLVRCRDCRHSCFLSNFSRYKCVKIRDKLFYSDDFCSYGERREKT